MSKEAWIFVFLVFLFVVGLAGDFVSKYGFKTLFAAITRSKTNQDDQEKMNFLDGSR